MVACSPSKEYSNYQWFINDSDEYSNLKKLLEKSKACKLVNYLILTQSDALRNSDEVIPRQLLNIKKPRVRENILLLVVKGAVKVHISDDRLIQVFKQELDILLRLQHDNIVKLLGYCDDLEEGALVFEYIHNGNLQEELHERNKEVLPWKTMIGCIAIGSRLQSFANFMAFIASLPSDNSYQQFIPKKGVSPTKHEIIFIAPTGEDISNKRQLEKYLKAHPGGPAVSEFYLGTGETPRRSARISEKAAASKDNKVSETASGGIEETKDIHMGEAEKSEKMNVEGEAGKNVRKMLKQYLRSPRMDFKLVLLDLFAPAEEERLESLLIEGKVKQPVAEAEKELQSWEQKRKKNEVGGEEKAKQERSTSESEGAIEEKQLSNYSQTGLLIKQDPGQLTSMIASQICGAFEIEKYY
ncbi:hypothetical protein GOBAR_AA31661 [Gossypium barbadense]|uniref:MBD domain-containing protein n=1 Tax=Gossypium barbadense TaxID=3634 RepID=A0A2P5WD54_GOSBA|nr:hypothetical protein GOBAR_AA31661 [Gossypium barbadense]